MSIEDSLDSVSFLNCTAKAIDRYIHLRSEDQTGKKEKIDPRLQSIIEGIFSRCIEDGEYKQVMEPCSRYITP